MKRPIKEKPSNKIRLARAIVVLACLGIFHSSLSLDAEENVALNQHDVLPILLLRCASCHGRQVQKGGLDIRKPEYLLKGGESGPAIVPGKPEESLLVQRIRAKEMPPRDQLASHSVKPVEPQELKMLEQWIAAGAPVVEVQPDVATVEPDPFISDADRQHWAFQPPEEVVPPLLKPVSKSVRTVNPIDAFVARKLRIRNLDFSPAANRYTMLRRASMDLVGLPLGQEEIRQFISDPHPDAYEKLIDRLLASPSYGERWGQFWLDLAGYSDSEGVQHSDPVRPFAYRFRDYVVRAFNDDKPYDRFLLEQIAGDELIDYEKADTITEEIYDNLVATGFLRMSSDGTFAGITGFVPNRLDVIDDQIRILSSSVMGLSIRCARCHSHKFDPIPQRDYYRLLALFKGAMDEHDWLRPIKSSVGNSRYLPFVTSVERRAWETAEQQLSGQIEELKKQLDVAKNQSDLAKTEKDKQVKQAEEKLKQLESQRKPQPMIRALWDRGEPSPTYLLRRGNYQQPSQFIGPGVPSILTDGKTPFTPEKPWPGSHKTGNRLALAKWLTHQDHPLTSRVMVNRIWKHHFGRGLVKTLDDFGRAGDPPSHPELLDWLANEFVRSAWSVKHMHRLIMKSRTYRQSSSATLEKVRLDPENKFLSRMPMRRMEAEVLRDSLLQIADRLNRTAFGPADPVSARKDGLVTSVQKGSAWRRSIYVQKRRSERLTILDTFDRPRMSPNCIERTESNVAPQALHLLNNKMIHQLSMALAESVITKAGDTDSHQIDMLFLLTLSRPPDEDERNAMTQTLNELTEMWKKSGEEPDQARLKALGNACHALMNSAAFLFID